MSKMWAGRFEKESSKLLEEFNGSIMFDKELYREDIAGSIAHSKMLAKVGIISDEEAKSIENGLLQVKSEIESGVFEFKIGDEDIHMSIEKRLTELIGEAGKKLHTARSRNDQVALDFRMYVLNKNLSIITQLMELIETTINISEANESVILAGMTHLQHAQPINFAYHMMAYCAMFERDIKRFKDSYMRNNISPIGCAALAGTVYNTDREFVAKELGFSGVSVNCLDTVSDRDFALELLFNISTLMMHISRLSEELILWSSYEFKYITISDDYATGSSIMPQKKNPDIPELLRGKSGRVYGNLISLLTVMKSLPLAYNKDMQEDKESVFDSVATVEISLNILNKLLQNITINRENMLKASKIGHLTATDLADYLVKHCGIPFREAHDITGRAVGYCESICKDLSEATFEELHAIDKRIKSDVLPYLSIENSMNARDSQGGTSLRRTREQIIYFKNFLEELKSEY